jgi:hypothetical protein
VADPAAATLGLVERGAQLHLNLQAETRSGSPWPTTANVAVLLGSDADAAGHGAKFGLGPKEDYSTNLLIGRERGRIEVRARNVE